MYYYHAPSGSPELDFLFERGGEGFDTYPLYATGFVKKMQGAGIVPEINVSELKVPEEEKKKKPENANGDLQDEILVIMEMFARGITPELTEL